jgi:cytochrome c-type biogenesis protein CcmH
VTARLAIALAAAVLASAALPAAGGAAVSQYEIETEVMCDTCNVPLYVAESPRADQLRREIRTLIDQGQDEEQVKATLKARYGPEILALPEESGFSLGAYLVPAAVAIALLAAAALLVASWRRRGRETAPEGPAEEPGSAEDRARLDDELERFGR